MAVSGFAQGTINFANSVTTEFYLGQYTAGALTGSAAATSAAGIDVGLFYSTSAFSTGSRTLISETGFSGL